jgi:hypothetical protein
MHRFPSKSILTILPTCTYVIGATI